MAERRMFAKTIIDSDAFLDMPQSTQLLYFHLSMRGDDDGFINNPKTIMRQIGVKDDDMRILCAKKFIIPFESGIVVIKHWKIHNYIQNDRKHDTKYKDELAQLEHDENRAYRVKRDSQSVVIQDDNTMDTEWIQDVSKMDTEDRLGKVSIGNTTPKSHSPSGGDENALVLHKPNSPTKKEPKRTEEEKTIFASI